MDEVNPILFYSLLYRIGELIAKTQIQLNHDPGGDPSYRLEMLENFIFEFYKMYLLFKISEDRSTFKDFKIYLMLPLIFSIKFFSENWQVGLGWPTNFSILFSSFLKILISCCSSIYIQRSRGRLAGFLDLVNASLETAFFWFITRYLKTQLSEYGLTHVSFSFLSSLIVVVWYFMLDYKVPLKILKSSLKDFKDGDTFLFFMFLGLMKFFEYPDIPKIYPSAFMFDDVMNDVFITTFTFCVLFIKGKKRKERSVTTLSNTVMVFFVSIMLFSSMYLYEEKRIDKYIFKTLISSTQINTLKSVIEICYLKRSEIIKPDRKGRNHFITVKIVFCLIFLYIKEYKKHLLIIANPMLNSIFIIYYLFNANWKIIELIPLPDTKVSLLFFLLFLLPFFDNDF